MSNMSKYMKSWRMLAFSAALLSTGTIAHAQGAAVAEPAEASVYPDAYSPSWSDNGIAMIAKQLSGTWASSAEIEAGRNEDGSVKTAKIMISISPAPIDGLTDTLYVESVRSDTPWAPYRQAVFQFYRYKGKVRIRTYEFATGSDSEGAFIAMGAVPEYFPELSVNQLIATMDVELEPTSTGFTGASPYPYPTGSGGAVEMTSSVTLDGDTLTTADRGYDAQGKVVWGAGADGSYTFERSAPWTVVTRRDDGMAIIQIGDPGEMVVETGDQMHVHYAGFMTDASMFDTSANRGIPFSFFYPPGQGAIEGFGIGMDGFALNGHRKLVIPGYLGYGARGNPRANIPPGADLLFNVHLADLTRPDPQPEPAPAED